MVYVYDYIKLNISEIRLLQIGVAINEITGKLNMPVIDILDLKEILYYSS